MGAQIIVIVTMGARPECASSQVIGEEELQTKRTYRQVDSTEFMQNDSLGYDFTTPFQTARASDNTFDCRLNYSNPLTLSCADTPVTGGRHLTTLYESVSTDCSA